MSGTTRDSLLAWLEERETASGATLARIAVYACGAVTDESVPEGWLRLLMNPVNDLPG